jgi:precorrin-2 dehydrogenase/sirohydrochlorin ferrochelatase
MLPIAIDPSRIRALVVGGGPQASKRIELLKASGLRDFRVIAPRPSQPLQRADFAGIGIVFICDLDEGEAVEVAGLAHTMGALVNVADRPALCDFHVPAVVRRGDLSIAVSTAGKSPALAMLVRQMLEDALDADWGARLDALAQLRSQWRAEGIEAEEVSRLSAAHAEGAGWLQRVAAVVS